MASSKRYFPHGSHSQGENKRMKLEHSSRKPTTVSATSDHQHPQKTFDKENSKISTKDSKDDGGCKKMIKNDGATAKEIIEKVKKPMEPYKRRQCWVIVSRMLEGRDGWAFKQPLDIKFLKGLEDESKVKSMPKSLKDIEAKLKFYSTPDEFAEDMRFVFSHGLLYPWKDEVHKIATRFSNNFENKWKDLKEEWAAELKLEERWAREERRLKKMNRKRRKEHESL
jgi:hypothetical protein